MADEQNKVQEGELAVKLTSAITGGLGNQPKGKVLRYLSESAFNTLAHSGFATVLNPGEDASDSVEEAQPTPAPTGKQAGGK